MTHLLALLLAGVAAACAAPAAAPVPDADSPLANLAFLTGRWVSAEGETVAEELWGEARGDAMIGSFAMRVGGRAVLYELFSVESRGAELVLVLRHFDAGLVPWASEREPDGALEFRLVELGDGRAVFEDSEPGGHGRLVYERTADGLEARVESTDGSVQAAFRFSPAG